MKLFAKDFVLSLSFRLEPVSVSSFESWDPLCCCLQIGSRLERYRKLWSGMLEQYLEFQLAQYQEGCSFSNRRCSPKGQSLAVFLLHRRCFDSHLGSLADWNYPGQKYPNAILISPFHGVDVRSVKIGLKSRLIARLVFSSGSQFPKRLLLLFEHTAPLNQLLLSICSLNSTRLTCHFRG
jgi:hypothetical protein